MPEKIVVNECTVEQEFTVNGTGTNLIANENLVTVKTSEKFFIGSIDREISNIFDDVEDIV